jgi:hypothetical protein
LKKLENDMKSISIGFFAVSLLLIGCKSSNSSNNSSPFTARIGRDMDQLYAPQERAPQPIDWVMIPGGGMSDTYTASKYCIVIDTQWQDIDSVAAFVSSETSDVLFMLITYDGSKGAVYHLDTDGYTPYLELSRKTKDERFKLYLEIHRGTQETLFAADLPALADVHTQDLVLRKVDSIPAWTDTRSATRSDFSSALGIPAVMRIQANEKLLYTYHVRQR